MMFDTLAGCCLFIGLCLGLGNAIQSQLNILKKVAAVLPVLLLGTPCFESVNLALLRVVVGDILLFGIS